MRVSTQNAHAALRSEHRSAHSSRRFTTRVAASIVVAGITLGLAAGCATPVPTPSAPAAETAPALSPDTNATLLADVTDALAAATKDRDADKLKGRLEGPALAVRTSQIEVAAVRDNDDLITDIPTTFQQVIINTDETWPRNSWAITDAGDDLTPPRLLVMQQNSARAHYKMWGWVQLRPGVEMPAFTEPTIGSESVAQDDTSLRFTPADAVAQYADLLVKGNQSDYVDNFEPVADDPFRSFMETWKSAQHDALQGDRVQGTYKITVDPMKDTPVLGVRTFQGGAMIMAALTTHEQMEAMQGATLSPQTKTAQALLHGKNPTNKLSATYIDMISLYIPPADSSDPITLLGYSHVQTAASVD
ncbi:MAG: hypothetical protein LBH13_09080 [Cellulomonadaceae bacterium]|jgi:hypothetical protein|nr:hypothetical protein [Cellulomonadaceae bacterium]